MSHRGLLALALAGTTLALVAAAGSGQTPVPPPPDTASRDGVKATATVSRANVSVGERFAVVVKVEGPAGTTWTFPERIADEHSELTTATPAPGEQPPPGSHRYDAAVFGLEDVSVPSIAVHYRLADGRDGDVKTAPVPLHIVSLLPKDQADPKLADVRPPVSLPAGVAFWVALVAGIGLIAAAVVAVVRRRHRPSEVAAAPVPEVAPDVEARAALDALAAAGMLDRGELREFYIELAEIAKRYLERRLDASVLEMTTSEMHAFLRDHPRAHRHAVTMRDLAGAADHVKFARGHGAVEAARHHLDSVRLLIADLEARIAAETAPAAGGKAA